MWLAYIFTLKGTNSFDWQFLSSICFGLKTTTTTLTVEISDFSTLRGTKPQISTPNDQPVPLHGSPAGVRILPRYQMNITNSVRRWRCLSRSETKTEEWKKQFHLVSSMFNTLTNLKRRATKKMSIVTMVFHWCKQNAIIFTDVVRLEVLLIKIWLVETSVISHGLE